MLQFEDFKKMELITAKVIEAWEHPNADKLYVLKIDTGKEEKQLVAGIRGSYAKDDLTGRTIVVINNLEPAVIRGEESQGMLLAVGDEKGITLLTPDRDIAPGCQVK